MRKKLFSLFLVLLAMLIMGCKTSAPPPPTTDNAIAFFVHTEFFPLVGPLQTVPGIPTSWSNPRDIIGGNTPRGDTSPFSVTTNAIGLAVVENKRVPAVWSVIWEGLVPGEIPELCLGDVNDFPVNPQRTTEIICYEILTPFFGTSITQGNAFTFSPQPVYTDNSSGSVATISGQGFSAQYGMPRVQYFDSGGTLISQGDATAVAPDGSWISAPMPDASQAAPGAYVGIIFNANENGGYTFMGTSSVSVLSPPPPPPPPNCVTATDGIQMVCDAN